MTPSNSEIQGPQARTIGSHLAHLRQQKGVSLKVICQHTKIPMSNLENLERDRLSDLPNRAYVAGYVRSVVKILGANVDEALLCLDETYRSQGLAPIQETIYSDHDPKEEKKQKDLVVKIGLAIVGLIVVVVAVSLLGNQNTQAPEKIATAAKEEVNPVITPETLTATTPLQAETTPTAVPVVTETIKVEAPEPVKVVETKPEEKETEKKKEFWPMAKELYQFDSGDSAAEAMELASDEIKNAGTVNGQHTVAIMATSDDVWLTHKSDADPVKKFVLKKGRFVIIRGQEVRLFIGNLGGAKLYLDGKPLKVHSSTGVKSLVFPQESHAKYKMPLFVYKDDGSVITSDEYLATQQ